MINDFEFNYISITELLAQLEKLNANRREYKQQKEVVKPVLTVSTSTIPKIRIDQSMHMKAYRYEAIDFLMIN